MININDIEKYGKIKCAAIRKDNEVYTGINHSECLKKREIGYLRDGIQGFITENYYFFDRKDSYIIAVYYNQIINKHGVEDELYSEDLIDKNKFIKQKKR